MLQVNLINFYVFDIIAVLFIMRSILRSVFQLRLFTQTIHLLSPNSFHLSTAFCLHKTDLTNCHQTSPVHDSSSSYYQFSR